MCLSFCTLQSLHLQIVHLGIWSAKNVDYLQVQRTDDTRAMQMGTVKLLTSKSIRSSLQENIEFKWLGTKRGVTNAHRTTESGLARRERREREILVGAGPQQVCRDLAR